MDDLRIRLCRYRNIQNSDIDGNLRSRLNLLILRPDFNIENTGVLSYCSIPAGIVCGILTGLRYGLLVVFLVPFVLRQDLLNLESCALRNLCITAIGNCDFPIIAPGLHHALLYLFVCDTNRENITVLHRHCQQLFAFERKKPDKGPVSRSDCAAVDLLDLFFRHLCRILNLQLTAFNDLSDRGVFFHPADINQLRTAEFHIFNSGREFTYFFVACRNTQHFCQFSEADKAAFGEFELINLPVRFPVKICSIAQNKLSKAVCDKGKSGYGLISVFLYSVKRILCRMAFQRKLRDFLNAVHVSQLIQMEVAAGDHLRKCNGYTKALRVLFQFFIAHRKGNTEHRVFFDLVVFVDDVVSFCFRITGKEIFPVCFDVGCCKLRHVPFLNICIAC